MQLQVGERGPERGVFGRLRSVDLEGAQERSRQKEIRLTPTRTPPHRPPMDPTPADITVDDVGDLLGGFDLDTEPKKERPKRPWNGEKKRIVPKAATRGVHPNKPGMAPPSGVFAEFIDPQPEYFEEGGLRRVRPYQCVFLLRALRGVRRVWS